MNIKYLIHKETSLVYSKEYYEEHKDNIDLTEFYVIMGINMQEYNNEWVNEGINDSGKPEDQAHYQGLIQPIELMQELLSHKEFIGFCKGNMIKYAYRAGHKNGESGKKDKEKYEAYKEFLNRHLYGRPLIERDEE